LTPEQLDAALGEQVIETIAPSEEPLSYLSIGRYQRCARQNDKNQITGDGPLAGCGRMTDRQSMSFYEVLVTSIDYSFYWIFFANCVGLYWPSPLSL
jgi:hypothetical protein